MKNYKHASHILISRLDVIIKHESNIKIEHIIWRDIKGTSFIRITKFTYNEMGDCSSNLVWAPLHQGPTASTYLSPLYLSLGNGLGLQWRKKERIGNSGSKLTMWLQILGERGESEMGRVSLLLFLA
jgi:hypothetical protein